MNSWLPWLGGLAAVCTSLSYVPQVRKAWPRGATKDLSWKMLSILTFGLGMWAVYGFLLGEWIIMIANTVGGSLAGLVLAFKVRDKMSE